MHFSLVFRRQLVIVSKFERKIAIVIRNPLERLSFKNNRSTFFVPGTQVTLVFCRRRKRDDAHPARRVQVALLIKLFVMAKNSFAWNHTHEAKEYAFPWTFVRNLSDFAPKKLSNQIAVSAMQPTCYRIRRNVVEWKDIDEDTLLIWHVLLILAQERCFLAAELAVSPSIAWRIRVVLEIKAARIKFRFASATELFIFRPQHRNVCIIIPWNESAVTYRAEKRACDDAIMDAALFADAVRFHKEFELDALQPPQLLVCEMNHLPVTLSCSIFRPNKKHATTTISVHFEQRRPSWRASRSSILRDTSAVDKSKIREGFSPPPDSEFKAGVIHLLSLPFVSVSYDTISNGDWQRMLFYESKKRSTTAPLGFCV